MKRIVFIIVLCILQIKTNAKAASVRYQMDGNFIQEVRDSVVSCDTIFTGKPGLVCIERRVMTLVKDVAVTPYPQNVTPYVIDMIFSQGERTLSREHFVSTNTWLSFWGVKKITCIFTLSPPGINNNLAVLDETIFSEPAYPIIFMASFFILVLVGIIIYHSVVKDDPLLIKKELAMMLVFMLGSLYFTEFDLRFLVIPLAIVIVTFVITQLIEVGKVMGKPSS